MIKLFEEYNNLKHLNRKFAYKVDDFFNLLFENHEVLELTLRASKAEYYYDVVLYYKSDHNTKLKSFIISIYDKYINMYYTTGDVDDEYPFIFGYMYDILSQHLKISDMNYVEGVDVYFDNDLSFELIDKINFSKEEYKVYVDAERFGL